MIATVLTRIRARPIRSGLKALVWLAVLAVAVTQLVGYLRFSAFARDLDAAMAIPPHGAVTETGWSFPSPHGRLSVSLPVYESEREAGGELATSSAFGTLGWLRRAYVTRIVGAYSTSPLLGRLADEFRAIRDERRLSSDEYLEMMVSAIQAIPYGEVDERVALPAEVLAAGSGVCTDKSVLLASLLVHEGYDTVLWVFPTQWHVAVGVASDEAQFRGLGYAFIETTAPSYIGQAATALGARGPVSLAPQQIALGGWREYGSGAEVEVILRQLGIARAASIGVSRVARSDDPGSERTRTYARRVLDSWVASGRARYIVANPHDRHEVYRVLVLTGAEPAVHRAYPAAAGAVVP